MYVRQTSKPFPEHKQARGSANPSTSAVAEHTIDSRHTTARNEAFVIDSNPHLHPDVHWRHGTSTVSPTLQIGSVAPLLTV